ncbi:hypothetical protein EFL41_07385 [Weissella cibaria]|nr:hypothetical protein [Weissella cibaria]
MNPKTVSTIVKTRLGTTAHVSFSFNKDITISMNNILFMAAVSKLDFNKHLGPFENPLIRTEEETFLLNQILECMRECKLYDPNNVVILVHPLSNRSIFKIK